MGQESNVYVVYGSDAKEMAKRILDAMKPDINRGMSVSLKPNLVVSKPSHTGATTDPEVVKGIIEYLQDFGVKDISIIESSWLGDDTEKAFKVCGYSDIEKHYGVKLYDLKKDKYQDVNGYKICLKALEADALINLPVLKCHCQTLLTCALKNMKGCIPDSEKRRFHTLGLHKPIAELNVNLPVALTVVDALIGDLTFEEGGNPVNMGRIIGGRDSVAIDAFAAELVGYEADRIPYIGLAESLGVGSSDYRLIEINQSKEGPVRPPDIVDNLKRQIRDSDACSACYSAAAHALLRTGYSGTIHVGQGYKGTSASGIGVGNCTKGFSQFVKGCPPTAHEIVDFLTGQINKGRKGL